MAGIALSDVLSVASTTRADCLVCDLTAPALVAHRGGLEVYPEHTMLAFETVTDAHPGIALEMDVAVLGDGTLVLAHGSTFTGADGIERKLAQMTEREWRTMRVPHPQGGAAAPPATLGDVLDRFGDTETLLLLELKAPQAADAFIEAIWDYRQQVLAQSFDEDLVSRFVRSDLHTLQLAWDDDFTMVDGIHSIGVNNSGTTAALVKAAHDRGVFVWVWGGGVTMTLPDTDDRGVDGFMVDDPTH